MPDVSLSCPHFQNEAKAFARDMAQYPSETIAETLTADDLNYSQRKLWITSFLYGLLRPLDGILIHLATEEYQHLFDWQRVRKEIRIIQPPMTYLHSLMRALNMSHLT